MKKNIVLFLISILFIGSTTKKIVQPNIIIIFMDDMGYGDLACYGALDYQTPNIDKLASEGIRFTNFLAAQAVCSASRAALLTGCYPNRIGISGALMPNSKIGIGQNEMTIAEMLKQKGYATGIFGKWHLGHQKQFLPLQHGFDEYLGIPYSNDMWPVDFDGKPITNADDYRKITYPPLPLIENNEQIETINDLKGQDKLTTLYTEKALGFIKRNKNKPFFLYLPHSMVHVPLGVSDKFKGKSKQGFFGDVMMEVDWSVGEIMKTLRENGLDKNTLVIFTSDNGPWLNFGNHAGSTAGLREGKGEIFEGGNRVPCIMRWKGVTPEGVICNQLTSTLDILPTLAKICGTKLSDNKIDGIDILPILKGNLSNSPRKYFYYYYANNELRAVRRDNWKLVLPHKNGQGYETMLPGVNGFPGKYAKVDVPMALYDLRRDSGEEYDVQTLNPEIVAELQEVAETARQDLGDNLTKISGKNNRLSGKID
ncbi:N-acetylgalactosamine-6-O-sulfatase [Emticicia aquatica]|uniref:N-acetylgalactosamine-6-O-sulfatase n=1 Tax=Emticicia aquatica TaxID=1681835 RepID=A0ABN8EU90_9BACT|nr:sulfatase [Emticicia aquatica]CAH0995501.1 N-acetylgalactosamine-6-O-sulfatase [Emticicia aquatica]